MSGPCELILVAIVGGYVRSSNPALLLVLVFLLRWDAVVCESSFSPPNFSSFSFRLLRRSKNHIKTPITKHPSIEAMTAAAMTPGEVRLLDFLALMSALDPADGVLVTVWVT
jgi:hypothetical protein